MAGFLQNGLISSAVLATTVVALALFFVPEVESRSMRRKKAVDAAPKRSGCKLFYYFDGGTEMCEHCRDICDHAKIWGTEEQCQRQCADYLRSRHCRSDEYYDDQIRTCSPCRDICQHHLISGTTGACQTYCPDYQPAAQTPRPTSRSPALEDRKEKKDTRQTHNPPASALTHHLVWIVPSVVLLIFFAAVGVALLIFKRRQSHPFIVKYQPASVTEESLTSYPPVTAPLTRPQTETQPGINSELVCSG